MDYEITQRVVVTGVTLRMTLEAARALAGCRWVNETISPQVDDLFAALAPFKEVQE